MGCCCTSTVWVPGPQQTTFTRFLRYACSLFLVSVRAFCAQDVVDYLKALGVAVVCIMSDNAANMKRAGEQLRQSNGTLPLWCLAHAGELLNKGVMSLWPGLMDRAASIEAYFRNHAYPRYHSTPAALCFWLHLLAGSAILRSKNGVQNDKKIILRKKFP